MICGQNVRSALDVLTVILHRDIEYQLYRFLKKHNFRAESPVLFVTVHLKYSHIRDIITNNKFDEQEDYMAVTYKKLFHLLIDRGIQTTELTEKAGFSANIITRLKRDQYVSLDSIEKICLALDCKVDDILDFIDTNGERK